MRGRDYFERYHWALAALVRGLSYVPRSTCLLMWRFAERRSGLLGAGLRYCMAKRLAAGCGRVVLIERDVEIRGWSELRIGDNVSIQRGCYIDATGGVTISKDVSIAHGTSIMSTDHSWADETIAIRENPLIYRPVTINEDVWIGCGVRILAGVTISPRSVIAAGAVVVKDVETRTLVGGVPARVIKAI